MYCWKEEKKKNTKQLDYNFSIPPSLVATGQRWRNNPKATTTIWRDAFFSRNTNPTDAANPPSRLLQIGTVSTGNFFHSHKKKEQFLFTIQSKIGINCYSINFLRVLYGLLSIQLCNTPKALPAKPWAKLAINKKNCALLIPPRLNAPVIRYLCTDSSFSFLWPLCSGRRIPAKREIFRDVSRNDVISRIEEAGYLRDRRVQRRVIRSF